VDTLQAPAPFSTRRIGTWSRASSDYPRQLLDLTRPPDPLYWIGSVDTLSGPLVSIVGTRNSTAYGERITRSLTRALVRSGVGIVSGMARGIDGAAHRTALEEGGRTIAVLGTGVDVPYPAGHRQLHRMVAERGLVLSENEPGSRAHKGSFPARNRIIAALSPLTIVVEAGFKSGALNTATQALELGRTVAAVPGPIDSEQSRGSNQLLRDGAIVIAAPDDALTALGLSPSDPNPIPVLPETEMKIWDAIGPGYAEIDALVQLTGLGLPAVLAGVTSLEIMGLIDCPASGEVRRR
jgi:DNA processing protein